jgi:23S rRNA (guanosine2251-2'-O)-methyltransferase
MSEGPRFRKRPPPKDFRGRKPQRGRDFGRPARAPSDVVILYGWHSVTLALENPQRKIRKLFATENAVRRLAEANITPHVTPEIVRPDQIAARLSADAVHQGLLAEADPHPRRPSTRWRPKASCWCWIRSPIRTMSARSCARRRRSA